MSLIVGMKRTDQSYARLVEGHISSQAFFDGLIHSGAYTVGGGLIHGPHQTSKYGIYC